jgi:hypothetical protein
MKSNSVTNRFVVAGASLALMAGMILTGCSKNDNGPNQPGTAMETTATDDAVLSIAGAMGDDNGGASNNIGDAIALASPDGIAGGLGTSLGKEYGTMTSTVIDSSYDPGTGWWTVTVTKQKNSASDQYYTKLSRTYRFQFLKNNVAQRYWRVANGAGADTADVIKFVIVSGTGEYKTPHIHHTLKGIAASFIMTNANTDTITANSDAPFVRSGIDTVTTANAVRTLDHTITLTFTDIRGPRVRPNSVFYTRRNLTNQTTGTVTGDYEAKVTVQRGDTYNEKTISRQFTITLSGGEGSIGINGDSRRFKVDLTNGDEK